MISDEIRAKLDGWRHGLGGERADGEWMVDGGDGYGQARRGAVLLSDYQTCILIIRITDSPHPFQ